MRLSTLTVLLSLLAGCAGSGGATDTNVSASIGDPANGATLFASNCSTCHGSDAHGGMGPNIAGVSDSNNVIDTIRYGNGQMPAFGDSLSDQDISDILAYLGTLS